MAGQGMNRREVLRMLAVGSAVAQFGVFEKWVYAHEHHQQELARTSQPYKPRFFNKHEYKTLVVLQDVMIPSDAEGPGAREAGASEFTDFIIAHDTANQPLFKKALKWFDTRAMELHKKKFVDLTREQQTAMLEPLAYKNKVKKGDEEGREQFRLVRRYAVMGYYTSKPGMESLGVPTLRHYSDSPECPHHDDPTHMNIKKRVQA